VHTYAPFLVERPFEQLKIGLNHQDVGAVLISIGASYDDPSWGRTHQSPGDVALIDTLPGWTVHVPGHEDEVEPLLRKAIACDDRVYMRLSERANSAAVPVENGFSVLRRGSAGVVIAVGPVLDQVLAATATVDVTVLYTSTIRPFDHAGLREAVAGSRPDVAIVEPYLRGTSAHEVADALADVPHRLRSFGVQRDRELRTYGTADEQDRLHGVDATGLAESFRGFFRKTLMRQCGFLYAGPADVRRQHTVGRIWTGEFIGGVRATRSWRGPRRCGTTHVLPCDNAGGTR
jgi:transketolase